MWLLKIMLTVLDIVEEFYQKVKREI